MHAIMKGACAIDISLEYKYFEITQLGKNNIASPSCMVKATLLLASHPWDISL